MLLQNDFQYLKKFLKDFEKKYFVNSQLKRILLKFNSLRGYFKTSVAKGVI